MSAESAPRNRNCPWPWTVALWWGIVGRTAGKVIRLQDVAVVCVDCNLKRGAARGNRSRNITTSVPRRTP